MLSYGSPVFWPLGGPDITNIGSACPLLPANTRFSPFSRGAPLGFFVHESPRMAPVRIGDRKGDRVGPTVAGVFAVVLWE